jgi:hypothetical protein
MSAHRIGRWLFGATGAAAALFVHFLPAPEESTAQPSARVAPPAVTTPVRPPGLSGAAPTLQAERLAPAPLGVAPALSAAARRPRVELPEKAPVAIVPADAAIVSVAPSPGALPAEALPVGPVPVGAATPARATVPIAPK